MKRYLLYPLVIVLSVSSLASAAGTETPAAEELTTSFTVILPETTSAAFDRTIKQGDLDKKYECKDVIKDPKSDWGPDEVDDNSSFPKRLYPNDDGKTKYLERVYKCTTVNSDLYRFFSEAVMNLAINDAKERFVRLLIDTAWHPQRNCPLRKCPVDGLYHHSGKAGIPACGYC